MSNNFSQYKPRLLEYLHSKGIHAQVGLINCFSPNHDDKNPSCEIFQEGFKCYACGIQGDIYDAVEILEGITVKKEQFKFLENLFGGNVHFTPPSKPEAVKEEFKPDEDACKFLENYLQQNNAAKKIFAQFITTRCYNQTAGAVTTYPEPVKTELVKHFLYWPGLDVVRRDVPSDVLRRAGIPLTHPEKGYSTWDHSGVILKLATGYKLHYYKDGVCEKRNSKGGVTFPFPVKVEKDRPVILMEGELKALVTQLAGFPDVRGVGGATSLTIAQIKEHLLDCKEIILFFDNDITGRKASGFIAYDESDRIKTNIPDKMIKAGYTGKIMVTSLPADCGYKDQEEVILAGKKYLIEDAIRNAREYTAPQKTQKHESIGSFTSYDTIPLKKLKTILAKLPLDQLDKEDRQPFISACIKACTNTDINRLLAAEGATDDEIKNENDFTPYFLVRCAEKYELSKYLRKDLEKALIPESEILKRIKLQQTLVEIDYRAAEKNKNAAQFLTTHGVRAAAMLVADVLAGKMIYVENERKHYFFNGHTWQREPDMAGVAYTILCSILRHFLQFHIGIKSTLLELLTKIEARRFRVELSQDFSGLNGIFQENILFDGPGVRETLTLADGVLDFSGGKLEYRKSTPEEYRRDFLPYKSDDVKNALEPEKFSEFMNSNFKNEKTLQTLMYYLSLVPSRNTQFKYGGIFIGKTHTGKTTTIELLKEIYPGMIERLPSDVLVSKGGRRINGNEATPYIARLEGKGAAIAQETERNGQLNNAFWKELTGNDTLTARGLYQAPHDFIPTAQIIMATNHSPRFDAHDEATIDRMVVIPFTVQHKKGEKGTKSLTTIMKNIRAEFPAIIKKLAELYIDLRINHEGMIPLSEECANYKQNYVKDQETDLDKFVNDCIEFDMSGGAYVPIQDVYARYLAYYNFEDDTKEALSRNKFVRYLKHDYIEINNKQKKINGEPVLCFFNIRLKSPEETASQQKTAQKENPPPPPPPDENPFEEEKEE